MTLSELTRKYDWFFVPRKEMQTCPCPKCGKKGLSYANHPHAYGYKDSSRIHCRYCQATFKRKEKA